MYMLIGVNGITVLGCLWMVYIPNLHFKYNDVVGENPKFSERPLTWSNGVVVVLSLLSRCTCGSCDVKIILYTVPNIFALGTSVV